MMTEKININQLFEKAMKDPELFSTLDIHHLLQSIENDKNDYLEKKTMEQITHEIYESVAQLTIPDNTKVEYCKKLAGYRLVDNIHELHIGKHVRWIRESSQSLTNGCIITNIKFLDNGTQVLGKNNQNRFIQFKFDECIIFQKMTLEEQLILMAYDYIEKA